MTHLASSRILAPGLVDDATLALLRDLVDVDVVLEADLAVPGDTLSRAVAQAVLGVDAVVVATDWRDDDDAVFVVVMAWALDLPVFEVDHPSGELFPVAS